MLICLLKLLSFWVIQKLIHLQQHKNPSSKHSKPKHLHIKENSKVITMLWNLIFDVTQDEIISHNKYFKLRSHLNWFKINKLI